MVTNSATINTIKKRWERAEFWLEVASVVGGLMVGVGLWIEGETTIGQRLVTGGVAMEVICAWWVLVSSRKLQNILETEFETLRLETAEANARAGDSLRVAAEATKQAAESNRNAIQLRKELEIEHAARLKIEPQLVWRKINPSQEELIAKWVAPYKDAPKTTFGMIEVSAYGPDSEAMELAAQLTEAFRNSGCMTLRVQVGQFGVAPIGILVEYKPAPEGTPRWQGNQWANIAVGIANALQQVGLYVLPPEPFKYLNPQSAHLDAPIRVIVGKR